MLGNTNAKIAGGVNVEELDIGCLVENKQTYSTNITTNTEKQYAYESEYKIDDNNVMDYSSTTPGGGYNKLNIISSFGGSRTSSIKSSIDLDFGQSYTGPQGLYRISKVSPNKDFLFVCHKSAATIFIVPLTKSGDDYSLGTPISLENIGATPTPNVNCFVSNDTFIIGIGANLNVYQYQNGEITLVKTIALSSTPQIMREYNGMLLVGYSNKLDIMDYSTEQILYTETIDCHSYFTIYKNFLIYGLYNVLNLTTLTKINITGESVGGAPGRCDDFYEYSDNVLFFAPAGSSGYYYNQDYYHVVKLDLNKNEKSAPFPVIGSDAAQPNMSYSGGFIYSFLFEDRLFFWYQYQSSSYTFFADLQENLATKIKYSIGVYKIEDAE